MDDVSIETTYYPLPFRKLPKQDLDYSSPGDSDDSYLVIIFMSFGMAFLFAGFVTFPIKEKQTRAKFMQILSGLHVGVYWFGTYCWDLVNYLIPCILIVILLAVCGISQLISGIQSV